MEKLSKVCDAADWFDEEIQNVILNELREPVRLHRKQWEFAMIFLALQKLGLLSDDKTGLSVGGGNERVLYSVARNVKKLFVTDLYSDETVWDCARTGDPDDFIKAHKPFEVDDSKIKALRMDMRNLDFEDNTFDFCYSSCAIEHIGTCEDFIQHFNEVNRCLKEGGYYVFTTEFHFGNETIENPNNYIFSPEYLEKMILESDLSLVGEPDATLTPNRINFPYPVNIKSFAREEENNLTAKLIDNFPHIILLKGRYPFTSILFITQKQKQKKRIDKINYEGIEESKNFLREGVNNYYNFLNHSRLSLNPFSILPRGVSRFYLDHHEYFNHLELDKAEKDNTLFHTDYFCFGVGKRFISIKFDILECDSDIMSEIQFRIHRYATLAPGHVESIYEHDNVIFSNDVFNKQFTIEVDDNFHYAVLAKIISGSFLINKISINVDTESTYKAIQNSQSIVEAMSHG